MLVFSNQLQIHIVRFKDVKSVAVCLIPFSGVVQYVNEIFSYVICINGRFLKNLYLAVSVTGVLFYFFFFLSLQNPHSLVKYTFLFGLIFSRCKENGIFKKKIIQKINPLCTKVGFEKENKIIFLLNKQEAMDFFN